MASILPKVRIEGRYFFTDNGRFLIRGIVYQLGPSIDPLSDESLPLLERDLPQFKELGLNTIYVYAIDPHKNHDKAMELLDRNGIYVIVGLTTPKKNINRLSPVESYTISLMAQILSAAHVMSSYNNTLGVIVANDVIMFSSEESASHTIPRHVSAAHIIRACVRDVKRYLTDIKRSDTLVGVVGPDDLSIRKAATRYLSSEGEGKVDFYALTNYDWCGKSSMEDSGWSTLVNNTFADFSMPVFLSEYGSNVIRPRKFQETTALYSEEMTKAFSGGCLYEYREAANRYGIVKVPKKGEWLVIEKMKEYWNFQSALMATEIAERPKAGKPYKHSKISQKDAYKDNEEESVEWQNVENLPGFPGEWGSVRNIVENIISR